MRRMAVNSAAYIPCRATYMGSFYDFFGQPLYQCAEELKSTLSSVHFLQEKKSAE